MPPPDSQPNLLSLPLELRLQIYGYIFPPEPQVIPYLKSSWKKHSLAPSILRTCKQIHDEALPILYSKNTFLISDPELVLRWLISIGRLNIKLLRNIRIWVDPVYSTENTLFTSAKNSTSWYKVLDRLAREATGLQHVEIYWDAEPSCSKFGAGKDLRFLQELAKIQVAKSMVIGGFYGMDWPQYLTEKTGVTVLEEHDTQSSLQDLRRFQGGTESGSLEGNGHFWYGSLD